MLRLQFYPLIFGISVTIILVGCQQKSTDKSRQNTKSDQIITLIARCKAKPPTEDWRGNNLIAAAEAVNAELKATGDKLSVRIQLIQDDKDWGATRRSLSWHRMPIKPQTLSFLGMNILEIGPLLT